MIVQAVPSDESGCGLYRTYMPAAYCGIAAEPNVPVEYSIAPDGRRYVSDAWSDGDVITVHRPLSRFLVEALTILQEKGVAVVIDIDDDLQAIPKGIPSWDPAQPHVNPDENWRWALKAAQQADWVTVSTPALAERYGRHGRVTIIENTVPPEWLARPRSESAPLTVGWAGSPSHHPYDLEETAGEVAAAVRRHQARFLTVGHADTLPRLGFDRGEGDVVDWVPIGEYPDAISQFDVGLVPLTDSKFNRAKSWLKGLELAALGVPFVASPLPEYRRLGAGLLAKRPRLWQRHLDSLLSDDRRRTELAEHGRDIAARWTIDLHAHRWWEAWEAGLQHRHRRPSAA